MISISNVFNTFTLCHDIRHVCSKSTIRRLGIRRTRTSAACRWDSYKTEPRRYIWRPGQNLKTTPTVCLLKRGSLIQQCINTHPPIHPFCCKQNISKKIIWYIICFKIRRVWRYQRGEIRCSGRVSSFWCCNSKMDRKKKQTQEEKNTLSIKHYTESLMNEQYLTTLKTHGLTDVLQQSH